MISADVSAETSRGADPRLDRARGCLLGQLAGDSLGSLVEFQGPAEIRRRYPNGVRDLEDGGTFDTLAGQPTDDSEMALAHAIDAGPTDDELYRRAVAWADDRRICAEVRACVASAADGPPDDYMTSMGWVRIALRNALWQLLHAPSLEEGVVDSVMRGGDTDTNGAICGALLGAVYGLAAIPTRWTEAVLRCRPEAGRPGVPRPRPKTYWPVDALDLAAQLLGVQSGT